MYDVFFNSFAVMFVAIDAIGVGPLYLMISEGASRKQRFQIAAKASLISFIILSIFAYGGQFFFNWIGVSLDSKNCWRNYFIYYCNRNASRQTKNA